MRIHKKEYKCKQMSTLKQMNTVQDANLKQYNIGEMQYIKYITFVLLGCCENTCLWRVLSRPGVSPVSVF